VEFSYQVSRRDPDWSIHSVQIVDEALAISGQGDYAILPVYQGAMVPVGSCFSYRAKDRLPAIQTSDVVGTYPGVGLWNMAMFALVKGASTAVLTWEDPDVEPGVEGKEGEIRSTVVLNRQARSLKLHFLEDADYVKVAKYYRGVAQERGNFHTFKEKMRQTPSLAKNIGALRFTVVPKWGRGGGAGWVIFLEEGESRIDYAFEEVADVAERLRQNLGLEKALVLVKAWTRQGYDMDYPDVLPAAEESGGNEGLARASERVRKLGWLFGLHDNPLILFQSAASTDKGDALVREDGTVVEGGIGIPRWRLYPCCPARMVKYAKNNYPTFKNVFGLNYIYSDQIAAMPLLECFSPDHPLTRQETIEAYKELIEYKRSHVGVVGSEIADEWAIPIFDAMGIAMNIAKDYAIPIPLFELVYRECVALESWPWGTLDLETIMNSIALGRMPYLTYPHRDYLQGLEDTKAAPKYGPGSYDRWWARGYQQDSFFLRGDQGWGAELGWYDRFVKNVYEVASPLNELTMLVQMTDHEYLTADRKVQKVSFENGMSVVLNRRATDYEYQGTRLPKLGFLVSGPNFVAFYAKSYQGLEYPDGALFTIRSLDDRPIAESRKVRIFHGFGDQRIKVGGQILKVAREETLDPSGS
jgi:hypothetical protein